MFAAASLTDAMKDVSTLWTQDGHPPLRLSFGASSTLARQIEQGAPANLFASADEKWMDYLAQKNLIVADTRKDLLGNDLVLVVPADKPQHVTIGPRLRPAGPARSRTAGSRPAIRRIVPVGIYAEQALKKLGMWDSRSPAPGAHRGCARRAAAGGTRRSTRRHRLSTPMPPCRKP